MRFASDISIFWLIPWAVISAVLAIWFYSNSNWFKELHKKWRVLFPILRAISLFLIGVLLIGLIFEAVNYRVEKPIIISLVDKSSSMKNYRDSSELNNLVCPL
jgi:RsiW-degrading membrane proteinase PrsW (M82 family)